MYFQFPWALKFANSFNFQKLGKESGIVIPIKKKSQVGAIKLPCFYWLKIRIMNNNNRIPPKVLLVVECCVLFGNCQRVAELGLKHMS